MGASGRTTRWRRIGIFESNSNFDATRSQKSYRLPDKIKNAQGSNDLSFPCTSMGRWEPVQNKIMYSGQVFPSVSTELVGRARRCVHRCGFHVTAQFYVSGAKAEKSPAPCNDLDNISVGLSSRHYDAKWYDRDQYTQNIATVSIYIRQRWAKFLFK